MNAASTTRTNLRKYGEEGLTEIMQTLKKAEADAGTQNAKAADLSTLIAVAQDHLQYLQANGLSKISQLQRAMSRLNQYEKSLAERGNERMQGLEEGLQKSETELEGMVDKAIGGVLKELEGMVDKAIA